MTSIEDSLTKPFKNLLFHVLFSNLVLGINKNDCWCCQSKMKLQIASDYNLDYSSHLNQEKVSGIYRCVVSVSQALSLEKTTTNILLFPFSSRILITLCLCVCVNKDSDQSVQIGNYGDIKGKIGTKICMSYAWNFELYEANYH